MEVARCFLLLSVIVATVECKLYSPCGIAKRFSDYSLFKYPLVGNISRATCIGGYRHYDTSHQLKNPNGVIYYGIFGLSDVDEYCRRYEFDGGHSFHADLVCLSLTVLNDTRNVRMYNRLCATDLVKKLECKDRLNNTVYVFDPIYKDIIDVTFGEEKAIVKYLDEKGIDYYTLPEDSSSSSTGNQSSTTKPSTIPLGNQTQSTTSHSSSTWESSSTSPSSPSTSQSPSTTDPSPVGRSSSTACSHILLTIVMVVQLLRACRSPRILAEKRHCLHISSHHFPEASLQDGPDYFEIDSRHHCGLAAKLQRKFEMLHSPSNYLRKPC